MTSADAYNLSAYKFWLDRQDRLLGIREPSPISGRRAVDASWRGPRIEREGAVTYLKLGAPFASGLPESCYEIPACGGFMLCARRSHARELAGSRDFDAQAAQRRRGCGLGTLLGIEGRDAGLRGSGSLKLLDLGHRGHARRQK